MYVCIRICMYIYIYMHMYPIYTGGLTTTAIPSKTGLSAPQVPPSRWASSDAAGTPRGRNEVISRGFVIPMK